MKPNAKLPLAAPTVGADRMTKRGGTCPLAYFCGGIPPLLLAAAQSARRRDRGSRGQLPRALLRLGLRRRHLPGRASSRCRGDLGEVGAVRCGVWADLARLDQRGRLHDPHDRAEGRPPDVTGVLGLGIGFAYWWSYFDLVSARAVRAARRAPTRWLVGHLGVTVTIAATGGVMVSMVQDTPADTPRPCR